MLVFSGARAECALPAASRVPTRPGSAAGAPPGARHPRPALGRRQAGPGVEVVGRGEDRVAVLVVAAREQPGLRGDLHEQRRGGLVDVQVGGGGLELAHPQTSGAQLGRRVGTPVVEQQLESADHLERRAGRRPLHQGRRTLGRRQRRDHVDPLPGGVAAAQGDADLARHPDLAARARRQQPPGEQLLGRRRGVLRQHGVAGRPGGGLAAALVDVLQQRPGGGTELGQQRGDLVLAGAVGGEGSQTAEPGALRDAPPELGDAADRTQPTRSTPTPGRGPPGGRRRRSRPPVRR